MTRGVRSRTGCSAPNTACELLIATVPPAPLLRSVPDAERLCAKPSPLVRRRLRARLLCGRDAISRPDTSAKPSRNVAYLSAMLRLAAGANHELSRPSLFRLIDNYLRETLQQSGRRRRSPSEFGVSERPFHRIFADQETTFERHVLIPCSSFFEICCDRIRCQTFPSPGSRVVRIFDAAHGSSHLQGKIGITPGTFARARVVRP